MLLATSIATVDSSQNRVFAAEQCLVADQSCSQIQALLKGAQLKVLDGAPQEHPLEWISEGLQQRCTSGQPVQTLHLIAHGRSGVFRIGDTWIDAEAVKAHAADLAHWGVETIALWSCHVGADAGFVALLAELTGARVLASADWLGRDGQGNEQLQLGEWSLADVSNASAWPASFFLAYGGHPTLSSQNSTSTVSKLSSRSSAEEYCFNTSYDGYFGFLKEGNQNNAVWAQDWSLYDELLISKIDVKYIDAGRGNFPEGWHNTGVTGNGVAAELSIIYEGNIESPYEVRGWLDAQYKYEGELSYAFFYIAEIVDANSGDIVDEGSVNLSRSDRAYAPVINSNHAGEGQSIVYLYQYGANGEAAPGKGEIKGGAQYWGSSVDFDDRNADSAIGKGDGLVGGGSKDPLDLDEICEPIEQSTAFTLTADAACEDNDGASLTDASFTFLVEGAEDTEGGSRDSLQGTYEYVITLGGGLADDDSYWDYDYRIEDLAGDVIKTGISVDLNDKTITVHDEDIKQFRVVFDVGTTAPGEQLRGDESVTLTLEKEGVVDGATSSLDRGDLDCDPVESDPAGFKVTETAACEVDGSLTDASFTFLVEGAVNPGSRERESLQGTY